MIPRHSSETSRAWRFRFSTSATIPSLFVFFNVFALNMLLQYRRVGRWHEYLFGERIYMLLSLLAKSALAWQVFAGTLQPA